MQKNNPKLRVVCAMSGGVDSAVSAALLVRAGFEVIGIFMKFWVDGLKAGEWKDRVLPNAEGLGPSTDSCLPQNRCCSEESEQRARQTALQLGIPFYVLDLRSEFKKLIVDKFIAETKKGLTPNPCVICNKKIKIGLLLKQARALGYDYVATGHYLRARKIGREYQLLKAKDKNKDQSYFLYTFTPDELKHLLFPLGHYTKPQVRKLASQFKLKVAGKPESQDICFLSGDHNNFLKKYLKLKQGDIRILETNEKIGEHLGLPLYTIGQRRGLVGGTGPYYVAKFDYHKNILYVVKNWNEAILYEKELVAEKVNWLSGKIPSQILKCGAVIRYGHPAFPCVVTRKNKQEYLVKFTKPQRAITPGQSVVFYDKSRVLGGGIIK